jgi:glutaredoxin
MDTSDSKEQAPSRCTIHGVALDSKGECVLCRRTREKIEGGRENLALLRRIAVFALFVGGVMLLGGVDLFDLLGKVTGSRTAPRPMPSTEEMPPNQPSPAPVDAGSELVAHPEEPEKEPLLPPPVSESDTVAEQDDGGTKDTEKPPGKTSERTPSIEISSEQVWNEFDINDARAKVKIVLYVSDHCADCERARAYMKRSGIHFTELNVNLSLDAREERDRLNPQKTAPTITIDDKVLIGFKPIEMELAINKAARNHLGR